MVSCDLLPLGFEKKRTSIFCSTGTPAIAAPLDSWLQPGCNRHSPAKGSSSRDGHVRKGWACRDEYADLSVGAWEGPNQQLPFLDYFVPALLLEGRLAMTRWLPLAADHCSLASCESECVSSPAAGAIKLTRYWTKSRSQEL